MIRIDSVSKQHGRQILFLEASAAVNRGEKVGLVGPNGAGKTTIFRLITREEEPDDGAGRDRSRRHDRLLQPGRRRDEGQERASRRRSTARARSPRPRASCTSSSTRSPTRRARTSWRRWSSASARRRRASRSSAATGSRRARARSSPASASRPTQMDGDVGALSGGWKMRVALARILLMQPDALLLDEPTNHLDLESILWLEGCLRGFEGALVMTSHDREFLNRIVTKIVEIDGGELITYSGDYDFYERQRALAEREQEAQYARQQAMLAKEEAFIARFKARASHAAQVQSRVKKLEKIEKVEPPKRRETVEFEFRPAPRSGDDVAAPRRRRTRRTASASVFDGPRPPDPAPRALVRDGRERRRQDHAAEARRRRARSPTPAASTLGAARQARLLRAALDGAARRRRARSARRSRTRSRRRRSARCARSPAASASRATTSRSAAGCSRAARSARLVLARMLYDPPNFLVLDEPTNHLDLATKEMLIRALADYEGTMLFVSHDRRFLAALTNRVLELDGATGRTSTAGGYAEYVVASGHEAPGHAGRRDMSATRSAAPARRAARRAAPGRRRTRELRVVARRARAPREDARLRGRRARDAAARRGSRRARSSARAS